MCDLEFCYVYVSFIDCEIQIKQCRTCITNTCMKSVFKKLEWSFLLVPEYRRTFF